MKRSHKLVIIVLLQVIFLFSMIGFKSFTMHTGTPVLLKSSPADPWDMFRGEYVRLNYEISRLESGKIKDDIEKKETAGGKTAYVVLAKGDKYWDALNISLQKPKPVSGQIYIKGKIQYYDGGAYNITYGIEAYYVPEGEGIKLEQQASLDILVRVDRFGNAVIEKIVP